MTEDPPNEAWSYAGFNFKIVEEGTTIICEETGAIGIVTDEVTILKGSIFYCTRKTYEAAYSHFKAHKVKLFNEEGNK